MDDGTIDRALLFDFYGELLTDRQKQYIDLHWNEDWSLAEIAEKYGLTRQGVWDILRRAEATMRGLEEKPGLFGATWSVGPRSKAYAGSLRSFCRTMRQAGISWHALRD